MVTEIILFFLALAGISTCCYIINNKRKSKAICHFGENCNAVLHSKYNKTFKVPNEFSGTVYYFLVATLAILLILGIQTIASFQIQSILITFAVISVIFSMYLTYLQAFVIKAWCEYCITSTVINILILITELFI